MGGEAFWSGGLESRKVCWKAGLDKRVVGGVRRGNRG